VATSFTFNPDRVAHFEATGWRAYYDRRWLKLLRLIVSLYQEQFHIPFPQSLLAAYYVTRAAKAWAPVDHEVAVVNRYYEQFYTMARRYSGLQFDPAWVAQLETRYNDVHRQLVGKPDKAEFVETMVALHSALFGVSAAQARASAELRVAANTTVDGSTNGWSTDVEGDWQRLEDQLSGCYRSIQQALHEPAPLTARR